MVQAIYFETTPPQRITTHFKQKLFFFPTHIHIYTHTWTASEISPQRSADFFWDIMYASKLEALRGPSGRVLCYDPTTEKVEVLVTGLHFANGLAIDVTESYLLFVETFRMRIGKLYLSGDKQGTVEYVVDGKPLAGCKSKRDLTMTMTRKYTKIVSQWNYYICIFFYCSLETNAIFISIPFLNFFSVLLRVLLV